jgi:hypothetical protein
LESCGRDGASAPTQLLHNQVTREVVVEAELQQQRIDVLLVQQVCIEKNKQGGGSSVQVSGTEGVFPPCVVILQVDLRLSVLRLPQLRRERRFFRVNERRWEPRILSGCGGGRPVRRKGKNERR